MVRIASLFETVSKKKVGEGAGDVECRTGTDRSFSTHKGPEFYAQCHKHKKDERHPLMESKMSVLSVWVSLCLLVTYQPLLPLV